MLITMSHQDLTLSVLPC